MRSPPRAAYLCAALVSRAAVGEEIRIELWRGRPAAHVEASSLPGGGLRATAHGGKFQIGSGEIATPMSLAAPVRLDGRGLSGGLTLWADGEEISAVESVDLEDYVASVVSAEVPSSWPKAALEAQAVAARTFAMAQKVAQGPLARFHLRASVLDQAYAQGGATLPGKEAARATRGEVLTFGEAPIAAYFSASCGGRSEAAEEAFHLPAGATPYLAGAREDDGDPDRGWTARIPLHDVSAALRKAGRILAPVSALSVAARTPSGRAREIVAGTNGGSRRIGAGELRQILGYEALPSLLFTVEVEKGVAVFRGRGSGHGVGLCQWGARGRAVRGSDYRAILAHYYPGAQIRRMY